MDELLRVGELARRSGVTVRALHHYDEVGLLCPTRRSAAGYRLYDGDDVTRLYRIVALRQLGLSVEAIGRVFAGDLALTPMLQAHREFVEDQIRTLTELRMRLDVTISSTSVDGLSSTDHLLDLITEVTRMDETMTHYFTEAQLGELSARKASDPKCVQAAADRWPQLIGSVQAAIDADTAPSSPQARALADEWMDLLREFHRDDPAMRESLYRMREANADEVVSFGGPTQEQIDFINAVNESR